MGTSWKQAMRLLSDMVRLIFFLPVACGTQANSSSEQWHDIFLWADTELVAAAAHTKMAAYEFYGLYDTNDEYAYRIPNPKPRMQP